MVIEDDKDQYLLHQQHGVGLAHAQVLRQELLYQKEREFVVEIVPANADSFGRDQYENDAAKSQTNFKNGNIFDDREWKSKILSVFAFLKFLRFQHGLNSETPKDDEKDQDANLGHIRAAEQDFIILVPCLFVVGRWQLFECQLFQNLTKLVALLMHNLSDSERIVLYWIFTI